MANQPLLSPSPSSADHQAFPEVADALRHRIDDIVRAWIGRLRQELPEVRSLPDSELQDNVPAILAGIVDALAGPDRRRLEHEAPEQGLKRFHQDYDIRALMHEDRLLRRVIVEQVDAQLGRRTRQDEAIALHTSIDLMMQQALVAFTDLQNARLRSGAESELKYLSFLSHDLNNNLGNVTLSLQLLRQKLVGFPEFAVDVATLDQAQESILSTIGGMGRLLQNERLRRGGAPVKIAPVNLRRLAAIIAQQSQRQAERKGIRIANDVPAEAIMNSDGELLTLALQNLLGNAVKYSTMGVVRIGAKQHQVGNDGQQDGDGRWTLTVTDEGPGISKEHLERIFAAFKRGESHGQTGVGLGLAIVSQVAKLLGAELTVESAVGIGSKFRLLLPTDGNPKGT